MEVWEFCVGNELIVKRHASFHKHSTMDLKTGEMYIELIQGRPIQLPAWESVEKIGDNWIAKYNHQIYNISDLYSKEGS